MELPDIKYIKAEYIETVSFFFSVTITTVWLKKFGSHSVIKAVTSVVRSHQQE